MKIDIEILKTLELKLTEYSKENGSIAEHNFSNMNMNMNMNMNTHCKSCSGSCSGSCTGNCYGLCAVGCIGSNITNPPQTPKS